ncbi:hypothetical protein Tco_0951196 [Tanacetum coccineum]|uniref:Reverse transcriptase domain-containing protein n=1 Tax=Tanacetum coccineum TaxID=301880 RepID=A0ABQ5DW76_9ASTR
MANLMDMLSKFVNANTSFYFRSGTLPGNTITKPYGRFKNGTLTPKWCYHSKDRKPFNHACRGDKGHDDLLANNGSTEQEVPPPVDSNSDSSIQILSPMWLSVGITTCNVGLIFVRALIYAFILDVKDLALPELTPNLHDDRACRWGDYPFALPPHEITLRVGKEAITFNLDQTSKYTADYNHMTVNKIDVIDMACDEYSQEVLGFSNVIASGNPTPYFEPIVSTASPNLTPFGDSDFLLMEEADSFLALEDDPTSSEVDPTYQDPEGDILLLEAILNSEPPPPLPNHEQYMPGGRKELKLCEAKAVESSVNEPPEVELKELPPHLEYAFLEGDDKLPVIIAKDLKDEEKASALQALGEALIPIDPKDQEKTTFTCPYGTFAYRRLPWAMQCYGYIPDDV